MGPLQNQQLRTLASFPRLGIEISLCTTCSAVTSLQYHPARSHILLGSTDGLANIYDITVSDGDEEAMAQVINHGPIPHSGNGHCDYVSFDVSKGL